MQKIWKIVHQDVKAWDFTWKVSMTLEAKNHLHAPLVHVIGYFTDRNRSSWGKKMFSKVLIPYTVGKLIENWTKNNTRAGSSNGLVTSYSCSKILKKIRENWNFNFTLSLEMFLLSTKWLYPLKIINILHQVDL